MSNKKLSKWLGSPEAKACAEAMRKGEREMYLSFSRDPNNGTKGWWTVSGIRHAAVVRASSAPEAAEKAKSAGAVMDWELQSVMFLGEDLPDVVTI